MDRRLSARATCTLVAFAVTCLAGAPGLVGGARADSPAVPAPALDPPGLASSTESAVFAGGCYWGVQAVFQHVKGVSIATAGYAGGHVRSPSYDMVSSGTTGHAESVRVVYDPKQVSYGKLLQVFFSVVHDPTELNRQGPDVGTQYRSIIFTTNDEQRQVASAYVAQLTKVHAFQEPIVTEIVPFTHFYVAETFEQDYLNHHLEDPYIVHNDLPKLRALKAQFPAVYQP